MKVTDATRNRMAVELAWRLNGTRGGIRHIIRDVEQALDLSHFDPLTRNSAVAGIVDQWATDAVDALLKEIK